jgi:NitT/TauT family transport system substrate-binding protein
METTQTRRRFLTTLSLAGVAGFTGAPFTPAASETLETTTVRIVNDGSICIAPLFAAEELLRAEGFADIHYIETPADRQVKALADGKLDFALSLLEAIPLIDAGAPIAVLAGVHVGCIELFAQEGIRGIGDLKGKRVGLQEAEPDLLILMAAQVGLDPAKDIEWVTAAPQIKPLDLFADGKIDAFLGFPPEPQELRARHAGHVIVNSAIDRPWSQYFCCQLVGSRDYIHRYPVATKRLLRAVLKAADLCAADPARVARRIVDRGFTSRYEFALQTLTDVPYKSWRDYDIEDSVRFYALRMNEAGLIKSAPQKIIAKGTDWRFLNELKRELKA